MHRFVGRSSIVAVALATTLGAGAALADTTGISPESIKSALSSTRTADSSFANAIKSSTFSYGERYARYEVASGDQGEFAALKSSGPTGAKVGILAPEHNGDIQFANPGVLTPQHNGDIQFAQAAALTPQHNGDIQFALAERPANAAFGDTQSECDSTPIKLADVGTALRSLSSEPAAVGKGSSFAQRLQLSESPTAMSNYKRFAGNGAVQGSPSFATIREALIAEGTSNTSFASRPVSEIALIKAALSGSSDASSALSNGTSSSQLASALRKR